MKCVQLRAATVVVTAVAVATVLGTAQVAGAEDEPTVPDVVAVGVVNMDATKHPISALDGRLVLLTFFAPWSERCVAALPHLTKTQNKWGGHGLSVLSVAEGSLDEIQPWTEEHGVEFVCAALPTLEYDRLKNALSVPGLPHAALISPDGKIVWSGHPQALKDRGIQPHMKGIRTPPPRLPEALAAQQKLFEAGTWAAARQSLVAARDGLDKISKRWADGLIEFVDARRASWLTQAEGYVSEGRYWDAWDMYTDFGTRFLGMEGVDDASVRAKALRDDAAARKDLAAGDDIVKAKELIEKGRPRPAQLVLRRVLKQAKGTVHAERAQSLLDSMK